MLTQVHDMVFELGKYENQVVQAVDRARQVCVVGRIWEHDHTLWKEQPDEIADRLGWLEAVETMVFDHGSNSCNVAGVDESHESHTKNCRATITLERQRQLDLCIESGAVV